MKTKKDISVYDAQIKALTMQIRTLRKELLRVCKEKVDIIKNNK